MKTQRGYTLIEKLVAMLILVMLSASGLYGWQYWQQSQRLWQTARQARAYLRYVREDANWHNRDHRICVTREWP
ncbi:prepilin-type N-terminal cleavage/methylation domain-containing protein, partial [Klebsiella pneumoniae]|nr:prepilin-type N-terminal cleavage/methylation domain-containing protein [Klebsiella pneumoniae]